MKRLISSSILLLLLVGFAVAQPKTMTGSVIDYTEGNSGKWAGIVVKVDSKRYFVYIESTDWPTATTIGKVKEVGRMVQVSYSKIIYPSDYDGDVVATKIVEITAPMTPRHPTENLIGYIRREHLNDGCGCTFHLKSEQNWTANSNVFSDDNDGAWINIDGQDIHLKLVKSPTTPRTTKVYIAAGVRVTLATTKGKSYGEGNDYTGTITVAEGNRKQILQIVGSCGC